MIFTTDPVFQNNQPGILPTTQNANNLTLIWYDLNILVVQYV